MAQGRTWAEWQEVGLSEAEHKLAACCKAGEPCELGDGTRPEAKSPEREIRAEFLRYLILGGCDAHKVAECGVDLYGAYVSGRLDLRLCRASGVTGLIDCRFEYPVAAMQARFDLIDLTRSALPGLNAEGVEVAGDVFLSGAETEGAVRLGGARIGGQLDCDGAKLRNAGGDALNAQGVEVTDAVFLRGAETEGEVRLSGARIGGQLACTGAKLRNAGGYALNAEGVEVTGHVFLREAETAGEVRLSGARISAQLVCIGTKLCNVDGHALIAQRSRVTESLLWGHVEVSEGHVSFASAHVGDLVDDLGSWPQGERVYLDGFTYDRIAGSFTDVKNRLDWLSRGSGWKGEFYPQPYTQLAKVLREMGHERDARIVLVERERIRRRYMRRRARERRMLPKVKLTGDVGVGFRSVGTDLRNVGVWLLNALQYVWSCLLRWTAGYGHVPSRSLISLVVLWALAIFLAEMAWREGSFAPNDGPVLVSEGWQDYVAADCVWLTGKSECKTNPAEMWSAEGAPGEDWDSFNAIGYGADVVVPILDLGQTDAWAPSKDRGKWGYRLWWGRWVLATLGWVVTALGAASLAGITTRQD